MGRITGELEKLFHACDEAFYLCEQDRTVRTPEMLELYENVIAVSKVETSVLLLGESGTGKEVVAKWIHASGGRASEPFIKVNCGAIPGELLESELFGYEPGAFTGAKRSGKPGLFELAHRGTLLLDEIGEMPLYLQVKLLRVLQEFEITRVGGTEAKKLDVRVISATNQDLEKKVREGIFRKDLYYRINVIPIHIPPLRRRKEDIGPLAHHFLKLLRVQYGIKKGITPEAINRLKAYHWPGNLRELRNTLERAYVISKNENIEASDLCFSDEKLQNCEKRSLRQQLEFFEKEIIRKQLEQSRSLREAAKILKIDPATMTRKCRKYGLSLKSFRGIQA
jgi:transcriptional regulator with PAS, ATPase and Fis domain